MAIRDHALSAALLVPFTWGAIEALLALGPLPRLDTVGLWRLAGVGVIAYGLARWRIYDLPQRTAKAAATAGGATAAVAGSAATYGAATLLFAGGVAPVLAALGVFGVSLPASLRFARRLIEKRMSPSATEAESSAYGQRIDAYRAALEASLARGTLEEDRPFLAALRERFGISEDEDRVLHHLARGSVIVPREGDASGAYERLRLLGEGGGGRTWLARDRAHDRLVVLKEPLERWQREARVREAVLREARLAAKVRHPNVVRIEAVVETKNSPVIVMEYLEGGSLTDLLRRRERLPWREAAALMVDVLAGMEAIHERGIVHRDVKPSNILLTSEGVPKVADFGVAVPVSSTKTVIDGGTTVAGTLAYMAPEMQRGDIGSRAADVYGCAAVLHELVHGVPPMNGAMVGAGAGTPTALAGILARGLSPNPRERYQSARAFAEALRREAGSK